jgi:hypothetical protein
VPKVFLSHSALSLMDWWYFEIFFSGCLLCILRYLYTWRKKLSRDLSLWPETNTIAYFLSASVSKKNVLQQWHLEVMIAPTIAPQGASTWGVSLLFLSPGMNFSGPSNRTRVVAEKYRMKFSLMLSKKKKRRTIVVEVVSR